jgi:hypothetical protein
MISISQSKLGSQISRITRFFLGDARQTSEHLIPTVASIPQSVSAELSAPNHRREFQVRYPNRHPGLRISRFTGFSNLDFFPYLQLDSAGTVVRANPAFFRQFEFDRESIIGLPISCFVQQWETASLLKSLVDSARITSVASEWQSKKFNDSIPVLLNISYEPATRMFHMSVVPQLEGNTVSL